MLQSEEPPQRIYWLETSAINSVNAETPPFDISLAPGLDSNQIWILQTDQRLNYYAGAVWPDNLGRVLRSVVDRSLNINTGTETATVDVLIDRFFVVEGVADSLPVVELRAHIRSADGQRTKCTFTTDAASATARLRDIVAAHQQVLDELIRALADYPSTC